MAKSELAKLSEVKHYACKMRDGSYRHVEAVSWADAKRHYGSKAVSVRIVDVPAHALSRVLQGSQHVLRVLYETGRDHLK